MKPELSVVGIDLAKSLFHLVGMDERGKIIVRKRLARGEVMPFMAKLPRVLVGMEACGGAHYWARQLREQGHEVKLMAPQYVKPYVKTNKNDLRDAEAIAEAVTRPSMRSEEHTSELQSQSNLVCRLLLEKQRREDSAYVRHGPRDGRLRLGRSSPLPPRPVTCPAGGAIGGHEGVTTDAFGAMKLSVDSSC